MKREAADLDILSTSNPRACDKTMRRVPSNAIMKPSDLYFFLLLVTAAVALPYLPAQRPASVQAGEQELSNAIVVEEHEHDLKQAEQLYTAVADDTAFADLVRQRAWLRLGLLYRKLGQEDNAGAALQRAATEPGEVGDEAHRLLQEPSQDKERLAQLREKARGLLAEVTGQVPGRGGDVSDRDLVWIGEPAVPEVIRALEAEWKERSSSNNQTEARLASILWQIGGDQAARFMAAAAEHPDVAYRRMIVGGLAQARNSVSTEMLEKAERFFADPDPDGMIPRAVLNLADLVPAILTVELVGHDLPEVRIDALIRLHNQWNGMQHDPEATMRALAPLLQKALDDVDPQVSQAATRFLSCDGIMAAGEGRSILLARLPDLPSTFAITNTNPNLWPRNVRGDTEQLDEVLKAARSLGPRLSSSPKSNELARLVTYYAGQWGRAAFDGILELVRLGYYSDRLHALATPDDRGQIFRTLADTEALWWVLRWFPDLDLPADLWPVLRRRDGELPELVKQGRLVEVANLFLVMARTGVSEVGPYLLEWIEKNTATRDAATHALIRLSDRNRSNVVIDCLRRAMVTDGGSPQTRNQLFARLAQLGDVDSIPLYAKAQALGVTQSTNYSLPSASTVTSAWGYEWLGAIPNLGADPWQGYEPAQLARCWDTLLSTDDIEAWTQSWVALNENSGSFIPLSSPVSDRGASIFVPPGFADPAPEVIEVLCRRWSERVTEPEFQPDPSRCLALLLWIPHVKGTADQSALHAIEDLHLACFRSRSTAVRQLALEMARPPLSEKIAAAVLAALFDDSFEVARAAIARFARAKEPVPKEALAKVLAHPSGAIRADAVDSLATAAGPAAYDMVAPLLQDPDGSVRIAACRYLGKMARGAAVPALLETLRDPDTGVHDAAEWALSAIRFYHDQKAHWDRVFAGTALSPNSAAEALIAQARADGNDEKVRLLAIESLGHLGVLEALPFLIGFSQESDADIAGAARQAIERIHDKAARQGPDAGGEKSGKK